MAPHAAIQIGIEHMKTVLAQHLGLVHGLVRLTHQLVSVHLFSLRKIGQPDAGRHQNGRGSAKVHRIGHRTQQALHGRCAGLRPCLVEQHDDKLVPAHACQRVAIPQRGPHAVGQ